MKKFAILDLRFANYLKRFRFVICDLAKTLFKKLYRKSNRKAAIVNRQSFFGSIDNRKSAIVNYKSGNAWVGLLIMLVFITTLGIALIADVTKTITQTKRAEQTVVAQSLCDAGVEKAMWKLNQTGGTYAGETDINMTTGTLDIVVTNIDSENKYVLATAYVPNKTSPQVTRKIRSKISAELNETNVSFHYGVHVGAGGAQMSNNSKILGNIYSAGNIEGGSNGSQITGDAFVSGEGNRIYSVTVGQSLAQPGNTWSHTLIDSYVWGNAKVKNASYKQNSTVQGSITYGDPPPEASLPITQNDIDSWQGWASAGGTYSGNYSVSGNVSLGPKKIDGNLTVNNGAVLTLNSIVWVTGNITIYQGATVQLAPSFGVNGGVLFADRPSDHSQGYITVENNAIIQGSGNSKSFLMLLSTSTYDPAISVANNSTAAVYYATQGFVDIKNNAHLKSVSGYGLRISNGAEVQYDSGLADANFSGGPGGSWQIKEWQVAY